MDATDVLAVAAAIVLVGAAVAAMAIGVMFRRPCLRGSCGGPAACSACPSRREPAPPVREHNF